MKSIKARVIGGRLVVDEPTEFPDGTELELTVTGQDDDLSDAERVALHEALHASWKRVEAGELRRARDLPDRLDRTE